MPLGLGGKGLALAAGEQPPMAGLVDTAVANITDRSNTETPRLWRGKQLSHPWFPPTKTRPTITRTTFFLRSRFSASF